MTLSNSLTDVRVSVAYCNMAKANKIRAWARKNKAAVHLSRYATDAYEGYVSIPSPWNEGADVAKAKAAELKALL